jgi:hypothetical protein
MSLGDFLDNAKREAQVLKGDATKDTRFSSEHSYPDDASAAEAFARAREKLFNVDAWSTLPGFSAKFGLYDRDGLRKTDGPAVGDCVRITLPGPLPENWVMVTDVRTGLQEAQFTVSPCGNPKARAESTVGEVAHFFGGEATSTFRVELQGNTLVASEIGRNERINNQGDEAGGRAVVNTLIAESGWALFQEMQWKKLTDYLAHRQ